MASFKAVLPSKKGQLFFKSKFYISFPDKKKFMEKKQHGISRQKGRDQQDGSQKDDNTQDI